MIAYEAIPSPLKSKSLVAFLHRNRAISDTCLGISGTAVLRSVDMAPRKAPKADITTLPDEVLETIMDAIASKPWPAKTRGTTLLALACVNASARNSLAESPAFDRILGELAPNLDRRCPTREALALLSGTGCELCKRKRIRKVYWEFRVRCCSECFKEHSINEFYVSEPAAKKLVAGLPYIELEGFNPNARSGHKVWKAKYYWRPSVLDRVKAQGSYSTIEEFVEAAIQARLAQQEIDRKVQAERNRTRCTTHRLLRERGVSAEATRSLPPSVVEFSEQVLERALRLESSLRGVGLRPCNIHGSAAASRYILEGDTSADEAASAIRAEKGPYAIELDANREAQLALRESRKAASAKRSRLGARLKRRGLDFIYEHLKGLRAAKVNSLGPEKEFVERALQLKAFMGRDGVGDAMPIDHEFFDAFFVAPGLSATELSEIWGRQRGIAQKHAEWALRLAMLGLREDHPICERIRFIQRDILTKGEVMVRRAEMFVPMLRSWGLQADNVPMFVIEQVLEGTVELIEGVRRARNWIRLGM